MSLAGKKTTRQKKKKLAAKRNRTRRIKVDATIVEGRLYCPECDMEIKARADDYGLRGNNYYYFIHYCSCGASVTSYCDSSLKRTLPPAPSLSRLRFRREPNPRYSISKTEVKELLKKGII